MVKSPGKNALTFKHYLLMVVVGVILLLPAAILLCIPLERLLLDGRFRYFSNAPQSDYIVHIDIDDRSLEELGRWPWPRQQMAGIIDVLTDADADAVALDIIMPDPQETRYESPGLSVYTGVEQKLLGQSAPVPVFDDALLAQAMQKNGRVFLPMHAQLPDEPPKLPSKEYAIQLVLRSLRRVLEENPLMSEEVLRQKTSSENSSGLIHRARVLVIEDRVAAVFKSQQRDPGHSMPPSFQTVLQQAMPELPADQLTEEYEITRRAYLNQRGLYALRRFLITSENLKGLRREGTITPPLALLADSAYGSGFVPVQPDPDGVVRRIPMLIASEKGEYPQFALAIARDRLGKTIGQSLPYAADEGHVYLGDHRAIPLADRTDMLINWSVPEEAQENHISAAAVGAIYLQRENLQRNAIRRRLLCFALLEMQQQWPSEALEAAFGQLVDLDTQLLTLQQQCTQAQAQAMRHQTFGSGPFPGESPEVFTREMRQVEEQIDRLCGEFIAELSKPESLAIFLGYPQAATLSVEDSALPAAQVEQRRQAQQYLDLIAMTQRENRKIERELFQQIAELKKRVGGKLCLVGSVSTGAADFVPTPIDSRLPGVVVHANILNTILSGAFIHKSSPWFDAMGGVLILVCIYAMTKGSVWKGGLLVLTAMLAYAWFNAAILFQRLSILAPLAVPLVACALTAVLIIVIRQLTEEREKRHIKGLFANALSPALVDQLIADPSLLKLGGERRELTFYFSDLQGFTSLSERLGEEGTVRLLNRYFDRMTEVIQNRSGGYLNKFLGDGLFVFFGAPVLQKDHAARAIRAAVHCQQEVTDLNRELQDELGNDISLVCRIGLSTGTVMVGNCGSSEKFDYTAIGDSVNLASRLESANKFFGTRVLVAEETWRQGRDESLLVRPLAKIVVVGKEEPVGVWEIAGPKDAFDENTRKAYGLFAEAMACWQERKFTEAADLLSQVRGQLPQDRPAKIFHELAIAYQQAPPEPSWAGELRLTEK
jgi:class 3 adenylate cyclase